MDVTFKQALSYLNDKLPQDGGECIKHLYGLLVPLEGMRTIKTYFPKDYKTDLAGKAFPIESVWGDYETEDQIYSILRRHLSVSDMAVERTDETHQFVIPIEPIGPQYDWDTFSQDVEDPSNLSEWAGPGMLIQLMDHDWDEGWESLISHFGWKLDGKPEFPSGRWWIPLEDFYEKLKAHGLKRLIWLWRVNTWTTGNLFWDLNLYDEQTYGEDLYESEAIPRLLKEWRRAQRIHTLYEAAVQAVLDNPDLIPLQVKLFQEAIVLREENKDS